MPRETQGEYFRALTMARSESPDLERVRRLLIGASRKGDARAKYAIATWYLNGNEITEVDEREGVSRLFDLVESNIAEALFDLAVAYDLGRGAEKDDATAFSFYMRAALLGDKEACDQVSQFYREGKVVPFDKALSEAWAARARQNEADISPPYRLRLEITALR